MNGKVSKNIRRETEREAQKLALWQAHQRHRAIFWFWQKLSKWLIQPISPERKKFINRKLKKAYIENRRKRK